MGYKKVNCPVCGNEGPVNTMFEYHKCLFCRRKFKVIYKNNGRSKHIIDAVENVDYKKEAAVDID